MSTILSLVLVLIFIVSTLVVLVIAASFIFGFDFGVRVGDGNIIRQVSPAAITAVLALAVIIASVSLLLLKKLYAG